VAKRPGPKPRICSWPHEERCYDQHADEGTDRSRAATLGQRSNQPRGERQRQDYVLDRQCCRDVCTRGPSEAAPRGEAHGGDTETETEGHMKRSSPETCLGSKRLEEPQRPADISP